MCKITGVIKTEKDTAFLCIFMASPWHWSLSTFLYSQLTPCTNILTNCVNILHTKFYCFMYLSSDS